MFEMLVLVFTNTARPMRYGSDTDMAGKTLCGPAGWATFFFDHKGRNWLRDGVITLQQPTNIDDCFEMLIAGTVDGVVINEFSGRQKIKELGLTGQVDVAAGRPIAIDGLHVVAHKDHPRATALVEVVNAGLSRIKADGTYQATIDAHLTRIWADF
jgi:polar amino acid transport system substrate-binding protein